MKALIGVETLRKLPAGPVDIRDTKLRGFVLRVRPSGVHTYFANYARGKWKVLGTTQVLTPPEARESARAVLGDAMAGGDPIAEALINTDIAKDELAAQLQVAKPGPGYIHIPKRLGPAFVEQLTAEERRDKLDAGGVVTGFEWRRRGEVRNEGLDCACINLALFHKVTKSQWLHLLVARHGQERGVERWQAHYPGERISVPTPPQPVSDRGPWLSRNHR